MPVSAKKKDATDGALIGDPGLADEQRDDESEDVVLELPCPPLDASSRQHVVDRVRAAFDARDKANEAEVEATRIIEEEVLPVWLD